MHPIRAIHWLWIALWRTPQTGPTTLVHSGGCRVRPQRAEAVRQALEQLHWYT